MNDQYRYRIKSVHQPLTVVLCHKKICCEYDQDDDGHGEDYLRI